MTSFGKAQVRILAQKNKLVNFLFHLSSIFLEFVYGFHAWIDTQQFLSRMESENSSSKTHSWTVGQVDLDIGQVQNLGLSVETARE